MCDSSFQFRNCPFSTDIASHFSGIIAFDIVDPITVDCIFNDTTWMEDFDLSGITCWFGSFP